MLVFKTACTVRSHWMSRGYRIRVSCNCFLPLLLKYADSRESMRHDQSPGHELQPASWQFYGLAWKLLRSQPRKGRKERSGCIFLYTKARFNKHFRLGRRSMRSMRANGSPRGPSKNRPVLRPPASPYATPYSSTTAFTADSGGSTASGMQVL